MRVISGKYRGKRLKTPEGNGVRPTTDRVKEAMFSVIQFDVPGADVLDLFAGSGALGIEALSRGANRCVFVEANHAHADVLKHNLETIDADYRVIISDYMRALNQLKPDAFDLILMDPPYESAFYKNAMTFLIENDMIKKNGTVVLETKTGKEIDPPETLTLMKTKVYGTTTLLFLKKE